jgi:5'-3' exonuclease, N-terminal resolvase-like domain
MPQFSLAREAVRAYGLPIYEVPGYEADDAIATLTRQALEAGVECVTIVSALLDMLGAIVFACNATRFSALLLLRHGARLASARGRNGMPSFNSSHI